MSKKKFLAKMCLASLLFGGNCNANPRKVESLVWGKKDKKNDKQNEENAKMDNDYIPLLNLDSEGKAFDTLDIGISNKSWLRYLVVTYDDIEEKRMLTDGKQYEELQKVKGDYNTDKCILCLCEFNESNQVCVKISTDNLEDCNHLIHAECLTKWIKEKRDGICPLDRSKIEKIYFLLDVSCLFDSDEVKNVRTIAKQLKEAWHTSCISRVMKNGRLKITPCLGLIFIICFFVGYYIARSLPSYHIARRIRQRGCGDDNRGKSIITAFDRRKRVITTKSDKWLGLDPSRQLLRRYEDIKKLEDVLIKNYQFDFKFVSSIFEQFKYPLTVGDAVNAVCKNYFKK